MEDLVLNLGQDPLCVIDIFYLGNFLSELIFEGEWKFVLKFNVVY